MCKEKLQIAKGNASTPQRMKNNKQPENPTHLRSNN